MKSNLVVCFLYRCHICSYSHPSQPGSWRYMKGHFIRAHRDEFSPEVFASIPCVEFSCKERFSNEQGLVLHQRCHMSGKPYELVCFVCMWRPIRESYGDDWHILKRHLLDNHPNLFDFPMSCICGELCADFNGFFTHRLEEAQKSQKQSEYKEITEYKNLSINQNLSVFPQLAISELSSADHGEDEHEEEED